VTASTIIGRQLLLRRATTQLSNYGKLDSQYFVGSASPFGHSIKHHSSGLGLTRL